MKPRLTRRVLTSLLAAAGTLLALPALADYPDKPIRMLVPFGAGGITDVIARAFADQLGRELKQTVVVENRPGAGGNIAAEALKRSVPDGYTLMLTTMGVLAVNPHAYATVRFDPLTDFAYVSTVANSPHAIVVGASVPAATLGELVTLAKQKPEALSYGTAGYGSSPFQGMKLFESATGATFMHVPFKSGSESVNNILGGQVALTLEALPVVLPHVASGKLKAVAIAAPARHASAPELKTTAELGYPGIRSSSLSGLIGPAGLAPEHVAKLNAAARKALESTEFKAKLFVQGSDAQASTPDQFLKLARAEHAKWGKLLASSPKL